jgi:hypothetical protein
LRFWGQVRDQPLGLDFPLKNLTVSKSFFFDVCFEF